MAMLGLLACTPDPEGRIGGDGVAIDGVPVTPPMGWNSWNTFGCNITEQIGREQADALVVTGLRDAGYRYVVVDDFMLDNFQHRTWINGTVWRRTDDLVHGFPCWSTTRALTATLVPTVKLAPAEGASTSTCRGVWV